MSNDDPIYLYLQKLDADDISPRQALDVVYDLLRLMK